MTISMQAIRITEDTYPIAAAALPGGFVNYPIRDTLGSWLVINKPEAKRFKGTGVRPVIVLVNCWMKDEEFQKRFYFVDENHDETKLSDILKY